MPPQPRSPAPSAPRRGALLGALLGACVGVVSAGAVAVAGVACGPAPRSPSTAAFVAAPLPWAERGPGGLAPIDPGTDEPALLSSAACATCHAGEHADWSASRHGLAWTNGIFQREYRDNPRRWCVHCHAPLRQQVALVSSGTRDALVDEGIGCAACHVREGKILARRRGPSSPHDTLVTDAFGSPAFCATCHQFPFPRFGTDGEPVALTSHPMQHTVAEFVASRPHHGEASCLGCHTAGAAGHRFPGAHDDRMLARAFRVRLCRGASGVQVSVANAGAGHRIPTGDVHRHANLRVWFPSAPEHLFEWFLGRRFALADDGGKTITHDSTLAPGQEQSYAVPWSRLGEPLPDEALSWELRYVYTVDENPRRPRDPGEPTWTIVTEGRARPEELPACP